MASFGAKDNDALPNREELLQMGIQAAKRGNKDGAKVAFEQILSQDKRNVRAMMWMAKLAENRAERKQWLNKVLAVDPENQAAQSALKKIAYKRSAKENRTLLIFGVVVGVLIVLAVVLLVVVAGGGAG